MRKLLTTEMNFIGQNSRGERSHTTARKCDHQSRDINVQCTERSIKLLVIVPQKHLERGLENDENADLYLSLKNGESET